MLAGKVADYEDEMRIPTVAFIAATLVFCMYYMYMCCMRVRDALVRCVDDMCVYVCKCGWKFQPSDFLQRCLVESLCMLI